MQSTNFTGKIQKKSISVIVSRYFEFKHGILASNQYNKCIFIIVCIIILLLFFYGNSQKIEQRKTTSTRLAKKMIKTI